MIHQIEVKYPGTKSKIKAAGVKDILVYMALQDFTIKTTPALSTFQYVGDVKYGSYTSHFDDTQEGMKAFYYIREKSTRGLLGNPSMVIGVVIS